MQTLRVLFRWGAVPFGRLVLRQNLDMGDLGRRLRNGLGELGATYVKLGQFLATRFDLLPPDVYREMQLLTDSAPRIPIEQVRGVIVAEFGREADELFDPGYGLQFIAAASIAVVYRARLEDGQIVAVKIQRPGIAEILHADFRLLRMLAAVGDFFRVMGEISLRDTVRSFIDATLREVDFRLEARASERIAKSTRPGIVVPAVRWDLTSRRVLTMEYIEGINIQQIINHLDAGKSLESLLPGVDVRKTVDILADETLSELYERGFFHGDPHPGNFIVRSDGSVALIDFGIFGQLPLSARRSLARFFECLAMGDIEGSCRYFLNVSSPTPWTDMRHYRRELSRVLSEWHDTTLYGQGPVADRHPARYMGRIAAVMRRNAVILEPNLVLFWRCILTLHALGLRLPVDFQMIPKFREFFDRTRTVQSTGLAEVLSADYALRLASALSKVPSPALVREGDVILAIRTEKTVGTIAAARERLRPILWGLAVVVLVLLLFKR